MPRMPIPLSTVTMLVLIAADSSLASSVKLVGELADQAQDRVLRRGVGEAAGRVRAGLGAGEPMMAPWRYSARRESSRSR